jgi:hypothetical protein
LRFELDDGSDDPLVIKTNTNGDIVPDLLNKITGLYLQKKSKTAIRLELRRFYDKDGNYYGKKWNGMELVKTDRLIWTRQMGPCNDGLERIQSHLRQRRSEENRSAHFSSLPHCVIGQNDVTRLASIMSFESMRILLQMEGGNYRNLNLFRGAAIDYLSPDAERSGMGDLDGAIVATNTTKASASLQRVIEVFSNALAASSHLPDELVIATSREQLAELVNHHFPKGTMDCERAFINGINENYVMHPAESSQVITDIMHCLNKILPFVFTARNSMEMIQVMVDIGE